MQQQGIDRSVLEANRQEIQNVLGTAIELHGQGRLEHAERLYRVLLGIDPLHADALHLLGVLANQVGNHAVAIDLIRRAIASRPNIAEFYFNLGVTLQSVERNSDAVSAYHDATRLQPDHRQAWENLGVAQQDLGRYDNAMRAYQRAIDLDATSVLAHKNLGTLMLNTGDVKAAAEHFRVALGSSPAAPELHMKLATATLRQGHYKTGWDEYEWRYCSPEFAQINTPPFAPYPKWNGMPLSGKTILVTPEQGIGDEVMFSSCFEDLIDLAGHCVVQCDRRLIDLFSRSFANASVFAADAPLPDLAIDYRIPAGSLPRWLERTTGRFPVRRQFLWADSRCVARWRDYLASNGSRLHVGISWRGGRTPRSKQARSIALPLWHELTGMDGLHFYSLQYGDQTSEIAAFNNDRDNPVIVPGGLDPFNDLDNFAGLVAALDLVITIDNSTAHFAGALGTPAWVLLPTGADWRWHETGDETPWYPSLRLFRQDTQTPADWRPVLTRVAQSLKDLHTDKPRDLSGAAPHVRHRRETLPEIRMAAGTQRAVLLNDTTNWYHFGCTATSLAIHAQLRSKGFAVATVPIQQITRLTDLPASEQDFDDADLFGRFANRYPALLATLAETDVVYVNGEGTLHRLSNQSVGLLYLAHIATTRLGKSVRIINHSCYPEGGDAGSDTASDIYSKVYAGLDIIAVRESTSAAVLGGLGLSITASFDCLPLYIEHLYTPGPRDERPYIVLAGGVTWQSETVAALARLVQHARHLGLVVKVLIGANANPAADDTGFVEALHATSANQYELVFATSESEWLDVIGGARLLVSGRFHHSIAAAFLGTAFLVSHSNTPKIAGLLDMLQLDALLPAPASQTPAEALKYGQVLLERAGHCLDRPADCMLDGRIRTTLLTLARQNFVEPAVRP